jgi:hypothetical protein
MRDVALQNEVLVNPQDLHNHHTLGLQQAKARASILTGMASISHRFSTASLHKAPISISEHVSFFVVRMYSCLGVRDTLGPGPDILCSSSCARLALKELATWDCMML